MQANKFFIFRYLTFITKLLEVKLKLLVFSFVPLVMQKLQKVESINIDRLQNKEQKQNSFIQCVCT